MAFNLPSPWDPGFALPDNVNAEGLERRAFVTKWAPRGTYDDPAVGTGGYAVPRYVEDEGYGQGAVVTEWAPRGTQPNVPHALNRRPQILSQRSLGPGRGTAITFAALSGVDEPTGLAPLHQEFGRRAAAEIVGRLQRLPPTERNAAVAQVLDRIDPTLRQRTVDLAKSTGQPFADALATAMATGFAKEVVDAGKRGGVRRHSELGLGCYGPVRAGLGGVFDSITGVIAPAAAAVAQRDTELLKLQQTQLGQQTGSYLEVGPFVLKPTLPQTLKLDVAALTTAQKSKLYAGLVNAIGRSPTQIASPNSNLWIAKAQLGDANATKQMKPWVKGVEAGLLPWFPLVSALPVYRFDQGGKRYVIKLRSIGTATRPRVEYLVEEYKGVIDAAFSAIERLVTRVVNLAVDIVGEVLGAVSGIACAVSSNPNAGQAAAVAAVAAGQPPQVGASGAQIAANLCQQPAAPAIPETSSNLLPLMVAGAGIGLVLLLRKKG